MKINIKTETGSKSYSPWKVLGAKKKKGLTMRTWISREGVEITPSLPCSTSTVKDKCLDSTQNKLLLVNTSVLLYITSKNYDYKPSNIWPLVRQQVLYFWNGWLVLKHAHSQIGLCVFVLALQNELELQNFYRELLQLQTNHLKLKQDKRCHYHYTIALQT